MADPEIDRKIAVIFATDVVGYSTSMETNEVQTLKNLKASKKILDNLFLQHGGRVFNTAGDSVLAEFSSAVSAVVCASEFQKLLIERNLSVTKEQKMEFRVGINMGDVVKEDGNLYGEGVNIAARLEALAKPNGICLSRNIYELVKTKTSFSFSDLGEKKMKNTTVHAFDIVTGHETPISQKQEGKGPNFFNRYVGLASLLILALGVLTYFLYTFSTESNLNSGKKTIAVLPIFNAVNDPSQDYFFDGITEDLIVDLSRIQAFSVISRNSVFQFKNKEYSDKDVADILNADYLLKGSARLRETSMRLNMELVDGANGNNIWADRFESSKEEIFQLQDELVLSVVKELSIKLTDSEEKIILASDTSDINAYDHYKRGLAAQNRHEARRLYREAIKADPQFARAYGSMAINLTLDLTGFNADSNKMTSSETDLLKSEAISFAKKAIDLDPEAAHSHFSLAFVYGQTKQFEKSQESTETALILEPENILALQLKATNQVNSGLFENALEVFREVRRLDPLFPQFVVLGEARAYLSLKKYSEALKLSEEALRRNPRSARAMLCYITAAWQLGQKEDAIWQLEELSVNVPDLDTVAMLQKSPWHTTTKDIISKSLSLVKSEMKQ